MKKILSALIIVLLFSVIPTAFSQEVTIAEEARQKLVEVTISTDGDVHVKHIVQNADTPKQVDLLEGERSNVTVTDEDGNKKQFAEVGDGFALLILPSMDDTVIEYDLDGELELIDNFWTWDFFYPLSTSFILPEEADLIFANSRPINLGDKSGIKCHGCDMLLEYSLNTPKSLNTIVWDDREFDLVIRTHTDISNLLFDQPTKRISFDVNEPNEFITVIMPLELLWEPYQVYLGSEKELFHKFLNNGTHAWLNFRPDTEGKISIIGTTVIPEFPVALLILSISIIAVIPLARKFNLR